MAKERFLNYYARGKWWKKKFLGYDGKNKLKFANEIIEKRFPKQNETDKFQGESWKIVSNTLGKPPFFLIKGKKILMYEDTIISKLEMEKEIIGARATSNGLVVITKTPYGVGGSKIITVGIVNNQLKKLSESSCELDKIWIGYHSYNKPFSNFHSFKDVSNSSLPIGYRTSDHTIVTKVYTIDDNGSLMPPVEYDEDEFTEFKKEMYHLNNLHGDPILVRKDNTNLEIGWNRGAGNLIRYATAFWWTDEQPIKDVNIEHIVRD